jgi:hypothetical protein
MRLIHRMPGLARTEGVAHLNRITRTTCRLSKLIIGLGSASIGAVAVFFFRNDSSAQGLQRHIAWPLIFFVASVVYGVAFIGMLVWRYELYCHRSETYTRPWYALILSLGFSMLICLAGGYAIFVWILLHA